MIIAKIWPPGNRGSRVFLRRLIFLLNVIAPVTSLAFGDTEGQSTAKSAIQEQDPNKIRPADVLARAILFADNLELVRQHMGLPKRKSWDLAIDRAAPREVYFLAISLEKKADNFAFEQTRKKTDSPVERKVGDILPVHVWRTINRAMSRLRLVKEKFGILVVIPEKTLPESTTPTQVFKKLVHVNRQINLMLDTKIQPADVFQKVSLAVNYAERILQSVSSKKPIPDAPKLIHGKKPDDVYKRLLKCFSLVSMIAKSSGHDVLSLELRDSPEIDIVPGDVLEVASLLVAELHYFHSRIPEITEPVPTFYPGRKFPSHVFQRAGILEAQLTEIVNLSDIRPDWFSYPREAQGSIK